LAAKSANTEARNGLFGTLLLLGFLDKKIGILGALGSIVTFTGTITIIPFMPGGWDPAGGSSAMTAMFLPNERRGSVGGVRLPAEAGRPEDIPVDCHDRLTPRRSPPN
jgi:hypothetical protein